MSPGRAERSSPTSDDGSLPEPKPVGPRDTPASQRHHVPMPYRLMSVRARTGPDFEERSAGWISVVVFDQPGTTARWHGITLTRSTGHENFYCNLETGQEYCITEPQRDNQRTRPGSTTPAVDDDARDAYEIYLAGGPLPGTRATL